MENKIDEEIQAPSWDTPQFQGDEELASPQEQNLMQELIRNYD